MDLIDEDEEEKQIKFLSDDFIDEEEEKRLLNDEELKVDSNPAQKVPIFQNEHPEILNKEAVFT